MRFLAALMLLPVMALAEESGGQDLGWLVGCWMTADGRSQEAWIAESDGMLVGFSVSVTDNEVGFYEVLTIRPRADGSLVYTAHLLGQAATSFLAVAIGENSVLFENADHDYPQQIRYRRAANHLYATISLLGGARPVSFDKIACE